MHTIDYQECTSWGYVACPKTSVPQGDATEMPEYLAYASHLYAEGYASAFRGIVASN